MRAFRRAASAVLALTLMVAGVVVPVEIVVAAYDRSPWLIPHDQWYRSARENSWDAPAARWLFIALVVAGLMLLGLQFLRRRPATLELGQHDEGGSPADLSRRSLERSLVRTASAVDGVAAARAQVTPNHARVTVSTTRRQPGDLRDRVSQGVERRIRGLGLVRTPPVSVRVRSRGDT